MDFRIKIDHTETQLLNQFCDTVSVKISFVSVAISSETLRQVKPLRYKEEKTTFKTSSKTYKAHMRIPTLPSFTSIPPSPIHHQLLCSVHLIMHAVYTYIHINMHIKMSRWARAHQEAEPWLLKGQQQFTFHLKPQTMREHNEKACSAAFWAPSGPILCHKQRANQCFNLSCVQGGKATHFWPLTILFS